MGNIICAVRGGPASQSTIEYAVALAKRKNISIVFLYVINLDFLAHTMTSRVAVINEDMRQMGELILMMAADVASAQELDAQTVIREGDVTEQIMALCSELDADYVVVGKPIVREGMSVFDDEKIQALTANLKRSCRAELVVAA